MLLVPDQRVTGVVPNLSHASAASALAHANHKPVEIWRPGRYTEAEKAALCMKDFTPPEFPQPSTGHSAAGLGAAVQAVREQTSPQTIQKHDIEVQQSRAQEKARQEKALRAATGAYATRKRADSAPSEPVVTSEPRYARTAAEASQHVPAEEEEPLDHLDGAMEASRITHAANQNARLYTASPTIPSEVEERNRQNSLRAAALSMAKDMYDVTESKGDTEVDPAVQAAQRGIGQTQYRKTVSGASGNAIRNALTLQEAAQKRAAEKLARLRNEHAEMQAYYGTAPQPQRSRLSTRRKRASSDADATPTDAERSRHIRHQMTSLRTKLDRVDEKRQQDRELLMKAAQRNVDQTMQDMDMRMWTDIGRAPPSIQKQWDEAAEARFRKEAESAEATGASAEATGAPANANRVNIGGRQFMEMADIEAVARSRVQPTLDEISDQAESQRAHDMEERLDAEEQERRATVEREREDDMRTATKGKKGIMIGRKGKKNKKATRKEEKGQYSMKFLSRISANKRDRLQQARIEGNEFLPAVEAQEQTST